MSVPPAETKGRAVGSAQLRIDDTSLKAKVAEVLGRWPSAGLAAGIVRGGSLEWFAGYGVADVGTKAPVTQDTVLRIGSITKTFTAIAVMQLGEQGLVDLDAPANDYLHSIRLVPAEARRQAAEPHYDTGAAGQLSAPAAEGKTDEATGLRSE
jgi:CubicO group peptidase (beta-lactamase class C family)